MKRTLLLLLVLTYTGYLMAQLPLPFKTRVKGMPRAYEKPTASTGLSVKKDHTGSPWIVFSDRAGNFTTTLPGGSTRLKQLEWMEPLFVMKEKDGYLKLARYGNSIVKGRVVTDRKSLINYGWIAKSKLLLWQRSFLNERTGFPGKAITIVSGEAPLSRPELYYDRTDSVLVFDSPDLQHAVGKVRLHQINYLFKRAEEGRKVLIGNNDQLLVDSARKAIFGWIAADAVHPWGDRLYIAPSDLEEDTATGLLGAGSADPLLTEQDIVLKGFPLVDINAKTITVAKALDVYDKANNSVITVDGASLKYPDYLEFRKHVRHLNVIWVLDASSSMKKYFAGLTNIIQSLETQFAQYNDAHQINYSAVVYRDNDNCAYHGISSMDSLSPDYRKLMGFLSAEAEKTRTCNDGVQALPLYDAVRKALEICKDRPHETNLLVVVGSVGDSLGNRRNLPEQLGQQNARLLTIQMYNEYNEWYNNFVLNAKDLVSESAVFAASRKKGFLVDGEGLNDQLLYNTSQLDSISYYLDYPSNSLIQGGVVFPTKGSVISKKYIHAAVQRFLEETDEDICHQLRSLDSAFRLSGIKHANLAAELNAQLPAPVGEQVADRMPHNAFKYYAKEQVAPDLVSRHPDELQYLLVLNSEEYSQLMDVFGGMTGANLETQHASFRNRLAKTYLDIPHNILHIDMRARDIRSLTLGQYFQVVSGLPATAAWLHRYRVQDLRQGMPAADLQHYLQWLRSTAENIKARALSYQHFISNGKQYYYITQQDISAKPAN